MTPCHQTGTQKAAIPSLTPAGAYPGCANHGPGFYPCRPPQPERWKSVSDFLVDSLAFSWVEGCQTPPKALETAWLSSPDAFELHPGVPLALPARIFRSAIKIFRTPVSRPQDVKSQNPPDSTDDNRFLSNFLWCLVLALSWELSHLSHVMSSQAAYWLQFVVLVQTGRHSCPRHLKHISCVVSSKEMQALVKT